MKRPCRIAGVLVCVAGVFILMALLLPKTAWWAIVGGALMVLGLRLIRCRR